MAFESNTMLANSDTVRHEFQGTLLILKLSLGDQIVAALGYVLNVIKAKVLLVPLAI
jgi:hypothetical protein